VEADGFGFDPHAAAVGILLNGQPARTGAGSAVSPAFPHRQSASAGRIPCATLVLLLSVVNHPD